MDCMVLMRIFDVIWRRDDIRRKFNDFWDFGMIQIFLIYIVMVFFIFGKYRNVVSVINNLRIF